MKKQILKLLIISLCISALIGIFIILTGNFGELEGKILGTTSSIFTFSIAGLCCSAIYEKEEYKTFSMLGMLIALCGCIWLILIIWGFLDFCLIFCNSESDFTWRMLWTLILLTYSSAHISLMLLIKNQNSIVVNVKNCTILFSIIFDVMLLVLAWNMIEEYDFYGRLLSVLAILIALGTIVAPILNKIYKKDSSIIDNDSIMQSNSQNMPVINKQLELTQVSLAEQTEYQEKDVTNETKL